MAEIRLMQPPTTMAPYHPTSERERKVTIFVNSFAGIFNNPTPSTLSFAFPASTSIQNVASSIFARVPAKAPCDSLYLTTNSNKRILRNNQEPLSSLLPSEHDTFLTLQLTARLRGGKGGFGSQLRAAGGRMSSRKKRNQQDQNPNGSNRNLDGRRLRTVDEAKRLAEYLAVKPDMEQKEKEERRKRWESVVEAAERREEEIKSGNAGDGKGRLDAEYVESKELAEERTREAVMKAMREGMLAGEGRTGSESSMDVEGEEDSEDEAEEGSSGSSEEMEAGKKEDEGRSFFGWDDEDEDDDSDEEDDEASAPAPQPAYEGKGKGRAT